MSMYLTNHYIIDDRDKELFNAMKIFIDAGLPNDEDKRTQTLYRLCYKKKRKIRFLQIGYNTQRIDFPRMNMFMWFFVTVIMRIADWFGKLEYD